MKTVLFGFLAAWVLTSCDPNSDQRVGNRDRFKSVTSNNGTGSGGGGGTGGGGSQGSGSNTTDAPIDGGLSVLLIAGAAYGANRVRRLKKETSRPA